jgi:hypothetical protein
MNKKIEVWVEEEVRKGDKLMKTENDYRKENMNFTFIIKIVRSQL